MASTNIKDSAAKQQPASSSISISADEWTTKIKEQLDIVGPYQNDDEIPRSIKIDEGILDAPRRHAADTTAAALAKSIAQILYPCAEGESALDGLSQYERDIVRLRRCVVQQRKRTIADNTEKNDLLRWNKRILKQGPWSEKLDPWSLAGAPSLPMPVQVAEPQTLEPFFEHLRLNGTEKLKSTPQAETNANEAKEPRYNVDILEFSKGVLYADGRMDLCKMAMGPRNIGELMKSLETNEFVSHFLLGNNIIGPHGAQCIADYLKVYPNRIMTWYLAGNCIDGPSLSLLVDQWVKSTSVTGIWLKRNPLGPSDAVIDTLFRLITQTPHLRVLDLDQTELGDEGVANLFSKLVKYKTTKALSLRHVYLNATGVSQKACNAIGEFLLMPLCRLESLSLMDNPIGASGAAELSLGLRGNRSLQRLNLASTGLTDHGVDRICSELREHPKIEALQLGCSFATPDLESRYNWISDISVHSIQALIIRSKTLKLLDLGPCAMTKPALARLLETTANSSLLFFQARSIHPPETTTVEASINSGYTKYKGLAHQQLVANVAREYGADVSYDSFIRDEKRFLINDMNFVRRIDSVYRNRDAGLARRGLKVLDKWWADDETLREVMDGAVGPVCMMRRVKIMAAVASEKTSEDTTGER